MQKLRSSRLEPRQLKNKLITSRHQPLPQSSTKNKEKNTSIQTRPKQQPNSTRLIADKPIMTPVRASRLETSASTSKRLKLKDYMHLYDVERRSKSKNTSRNKQSMISLEQTIKSQPMKQSEIESQKSVKIDPILEKKKRQTQYAEMIKKQIYLKFEQERKCINQLQTYFTKDFKAKQNSQETFLFLFNIYNKINNSIKMHTQIGEDVKKYQAKPGRETPKLNKDSYHWDKRDQVPSSPAKITSNENLKISMNMDNFHQFLEPK